MGNVEAQARFVTLADTLAEVKAETLADTSDDAEAKTLVDTLAEKLAVVKEWMNEQFY